MTPSPEDLLDPELLKFLKIANATLDWNAFHSKHEAWVRRFTPLGPFCCLPADVITQMSADRPRSPSPWDQAAMEAESDLLALCRRFGVLGFHGDCAVSYSYLVPPTPMFNEAYVARIMNAWGLTEAQCRNLNEEFAKVEKANDRLKGVAGWLVTEPEFLAEASKLAAAWAALPGDERPPFPLSRGAAVADVATTFRPAGSTASATFWNAFLAFCDRWSLTGIATWDLPEPQGTMIPVLLPIDSPAMPRQGLLLFVPAHYPLQGDDDLQSKIFKLQRQVVADQGLDESLAGLPRYKVYGQMLEIASVESTATARYASPRPPRGFVDRLEWGLSDHLGVEIDQIQRLRKAIAACRRGNRGKVACLQPRRR